MSSPSKPTSIDTSHFTDYQHNSNSIAVHTPLQHLTEEVAQTSIDTAVVVRHAHASSASSSRRLYQALPPLNGSYPVGHASLVMEGPRNTQGTGDSLLGLEVFAPTKMGDGRPLPLSLSPGHPLEKSLSPHQIRTL